MNAHTPFDANQDWTNPYCQNSSNDPMVDALLGNAYHVVRTVYCNLGNLKLIYDFLNQYGMVLGVQSEVELKALTTKASFASIYDKTPAGDRQVTDYLYVEGDRTGILPDDITATGSWVKVSTSSTGGGSGESNSDGGYIPWVYNSGSAIGGETTIRIPNETAGAPFMIVNGDWQTEGYYFEYDPVAFEIKFTTPLEQGDFVVVMRTGVPATPDNPNVSDWVTINWLYNQGAAVGGEQVIDIPYTFQSVPAVYKNGLRFYKGLVNNSYTIDSDNNRIILTEPLATNDRLIVQLGGEAKILEIVDRTIQEVARAANVKDTEVVLSTDTTQVLNGKKVLYDVVTQRIYELPTLPFNVYISSVSDGQLTYNPGSVVVNLLPAPNDAEVFVGELKAELASTDGINLIGGVSSVATPGYGLKFGDTSGIPTIKVADDTTQRVFLTKDVTHPDDFAVMQINRNANYSGGTVGFVGSALRVQTDIKTPSSVGTFEWAGLFIMNNMAPANTSGGGPGNGAVPQQVALYGQANKNSTSATWASCLEISDNQGTSANGQAIGQEITVRAIGADTSTPSRIGLHIAAHTPDNNLIGMEWGIAVYVSASTNQAIRFRDVFRVDSIVGNAVLLSNATTNQADAALIKDKGSLSVGIDLSGATYSSSVALRLKIAQRISLDENDTNQLYGSYAGIIAKGRLNMTNSFAVPSSGNVASTATEGGGASLPATVGGFITILIDGVPKKIPFYNA